MRKVLFFSFLLIFFSVPGAAAFEDTVERYSNGNPSSAWVLNPSDRFSTPLSGTTHVLHVDSTATFVSRDIISDPTYLSFIVRSVKNYASQSGGLRMRYIAGDTAAVLNPTANEIKCEIMIPQAAIQPNTKIEVIWSTSSIDVLVNGTVVSHKSATKHNNVKLHIHTETYLSGAYIELDDFTTTSVIGLPKIASEAVDDVHFTWSAQLLRQYDTPYEISLYSLTNPNNAGKLKTWTLGNGQGVPEHGYTSFSRADILGLNFGLYLLEMTRGNEILTDQYFYYDQLSSPNGYPELLFLGESSVKTEIRDENYNGGEIAGGGSVYLYPKIKEDAAYNFTYDILEAPYKIKTELTTVYNNTPINSTTINFSGLSNQNYKISVDGADTGSTNGADTFSHTFSDWSTEKNHIISFAPDYTLAGVWGEVKNSETQEGIKSATVSVSGENFSKTLYTDDNGLYYLTKGMEPGKTYTISVSKTGYSTPPSQTAITVDGTTTRQDFYMDKLSTSGSGMYYAPHTVIFTVYEYWYSATGLPGATYTVYDDSNELIKSGTTDSKGAFSVKEMNQSTRYTIQLTHGEKTYTEFIEPGLTAYDLVLNKEAAIHEYYNDWLNLSYSSSKGNISVDYTSKKPISSAEFTVKNNQGETIKTMNSAADTDTFSFEFSDGEYIIDFLIEAEDGSKAAQSWTVSYPQQVTLFPASYPGWLKNILFVAIILIFMLAFGKSRNDIACLAAAVLTSLGYYFSWLACSLNFVIMIWIISAIATHHHYKHTGGTG